MTTFEYGAMSSKFSCEAENKLTAYVTMILHYDSNNHLIALYEPKEIIKDDSWLSITGQVSERLDEIFGGENAFDKYVESHIEEIKACYKTIKRLI
jgi:16S rRNA G527 N7-methylase RsmG